MTTLNLRWGTLFKRFSFALLLIGYTTAHAAYFGAPGKEVHVKKSMTGGSSPFGYLEYLPAGYSESSTAPLVPIVIFLHGIGERGDGELNGYFNPALTNGFLKTGLPDMIHDGILSPTAIVLSPQLPTSYGSWPVAQIDTFLTYALGKYKKADKRRVYITGLSLGGKGAWEYSTKYSSRIAAVVPLCGGGGFTSDARLADKGVWAFHSYDDKVVPWTVTRNNVNAITASTADIMGGYTTGSTKTALYKISSRTHSWVAGEIINNQSHDLSPRFTMYPTGAHTQAMWNTVYKNADMWKWLHSYVNNDIPAPSPSPSPSPPAVAQEIKIDFGASAVVPSGWNNAQGLARGGSISLKSVAGATVGSLISVLPFNAANSDGTVSPSSSLNLPVVATQDTFFGNEKSFNGVVAAKAALELRGLDKAKTYTFEFFASRMSGDGTNRDSRYKVMGYSSVETSLNATNNTSKTVKVSVKPNANGIIRIEFTKGYANNNPYGAFYIGSIRIKY